MQDVALDDYLLHGPYTAVDVITEITGSERVNVVGLCLGGTLTAMLLAHMAARRDDRVRSATLLNTLIDFSEPGPLGCFVDGPTVARVERRMARRGYLRATELSTTFDLLRANDLIWNYVASNWLMGERPPAFDVLAWNQDGVRMPARMFAFYLRYCYLENQLARGEMNLAGTRLNLDAITEHVYLVAAKEDHIVPWASAYRSTQLLASPRRFVLTSSGHIAGIVNPPNGKGRYWTNEALPPDPNAWLAGTAEHSDSWWDDWTTWIAERAGERRAPPSLGSDRYPALGPAPGVYVHDT
jgi:polyhydroxyalkanoate synthase